MRRELSDELIDVWAEMMYKKIDSAIAANAFEEDDRKYCERRGWIDGISCGLSMFYALERGRFEREYNEIVNALKEVRRNDMKNIVKIKFNLITDVQEFVNITGTFKEDFEIHSGKYVVNAKSIMGILSLDLEKELEVYCDASVSEAYKEAVRKFTVE